MQKKYEEVIAWIRGELREGRLKQGDKLPSENMLKKRFHVSRQTVRKALSVLEEEQITRVCVAAERILRSGNGSGNVRCGLR